MRSGIPAATTARAPRNQQSAIPPLKKRSYKKYRKIDFDLLLATFIYDFIYFVPE